MDLYALANDPWRWQPHPEVWLLVLSVIFFGFWAKRIGPKVLPPETPIATRAQKISFIAAVFLLLTRPDSSIAKPAAISMTRKP